MGYTGTLWFLAKSGIKFRETMVIKNISSDEHKAVVECNADYYNGKKWIRCATTTCSIRSQESEVVKLTSFGHTGPRNSFDFELDIKTKILMRLPGISGQIAKKINSTFQDAVATFISNHHGILSKSLTFV